MATDAARAALQAAARAAVEELGSQAAVARTLGVSPRMIRHALAGSKGFNLAEPLQIAARGAVEEATLAARGARRTRATGDLAEVRRPVTRTPVADLFTTRAIDGDAARGLLAQNARANRRVVFEFEFRDSNGNVRTGRLGTHGGRDARAIHAAIRDGRYTGIAGFIVAEAPYDFGESGDDPDALLEVSFRYFDAPTRPDLI